MRINSIETLKRVALSFINSGLFFIKKIVHLTCYKIDNIEKREYLLHTKKNPYQMNAFLPISNRPLPSNRANSYRLRDLYFAKFDITYELIQK
ncbi:MAG: hypothetical protein ACJAV5_001636 [Vicingaceae bacterium]|jgi:hypothetical protein